MQSSGRFRFEEETVEKSNGLWPTGLRVHLSGIATRPIAKNVRLVSRNRVVEAMAASDLTLACEPAKKTLATAAAAR